MSTKREVEKTPTGIPGFDELVHGGIPKGTVSFLTGPPGSGKTLFSIQFLLNGITQNGEKGLYITLEERRQSVLKAMAYYGMELEEYEREGLLFLIDMGEIRKMTSAKERIEKRLVEFGAVTGLLDKLLSTNDVKRLVVDSVVPLALPYGQKEELREEMFRFVTFLQEKDVTALLITECLDEAGIETRYGIEQYLADGFITLGHERKAGGHVRTICLRKMRFTKHDTGIHPYSISTSGIEVSPKELVK